MHYAAIAPTKLLTNPETCLGTRPVQFCLAQVYRQDDEYARFYQRMVKEGRTVILDNGAWEGHLLGFDDLLEVMLDLKPSVTCLPDVLEDPKMTRYLHNAFKSFFEAKWQLYRKNTKLELMTILQPGDDHPWDLIDQYMHVSTPWVGFPRVICDADPSARVTLVKRLQSIGAWNTDRKHHALGWNGDSLEEWGFLAEAGFHSCDSSHPVWRQALQEHGDIDFGWDKNTYGNLANALAKVDRICSCK